MGDRGNIVVLDNSHPVFLYTHWDGSEILDTLHSALSRKQRWDDGPYLTRIIFCEMVKGAVGEETGYGISTEFVDNEHKVAVVDVPNQEVKIYPESVQDAEGPWWRARFEKKWTFEEFLATTKTERAAALGIETEVDD